MPNHKLNKTQEIQRVLELDALGTLWWIEAECTDQISNAIKKRIRNFEQDYSRFLPESYIGKLNDQKELSNPPDELLKMLAFHREMFHATHGVFNCSVGGVLEERGYGLAGRTATLQYDIDSAILLSHDKITLSSDTRIDLGGFGKGWLIDQIGILLHSAGCTAFVINGGGDILAGSDVKDIFIEDPYRAEHIIGSVELQNDALASSSVNKRRWKVGQTEYSHIVDTASVQQDASPALASIHVRADTALLADTLATVFLIVDHETRIQLAQKFSVTFLEVFEDYTMWAPTDFGFFRI